MDSIHGSLTPMGILHGTLSAVGGMSGDIGIPDSYERELVPATTSTLGGIIVGEDLQITPEGVLSVVKANAVESDNTHPITAAAVFTEVGNINALLNTI